MWYLVGSGAALSSPAAASLLGRAWLAGGGCGAVGSGWCVAMGVPSAVGRSGARGWGMAILSTLLLWLSVGNEQTAGMSVIKTIRPYVHHITCFHIQNILNISKHRRQSNFASIRFSANVIEECGVERCFHPVTS